MALQLCQDLSEGCSHRQLPPVLELCDLVLSLFAEFYCCRRAQLSCFGLWSSFPRAPQRGRRLVGAALAGPCRGVQPWRVLAGECSLCCCSSVLWSQSRDSLPSPARCRFPVLPWALILLCWTFTEVLLIRAGRDRTFSPVNSDFWLCCRGCEAGGFVWD